jgi:hypothetical protein
MRDSEQILFEYARNSQKKATVISRMAAKILAVSNKIFDEDDPEGILAMEKN